MIKTLSTYDVVNEIEDIRPDNFTRAGLFALVEYLEEYEESTGETIELDVIAICCDYREYKSAIECANDYNGFSTPFNNEKEALAWLHDKTIVINFDGGVIVQVF